MCCGRVLVVEEDSEQNFALRRSATHRRWRFDYLRYVADDRYVEDGGFADRRTLRV